MQGCRFFKIDCMPTFHLPYNENLIKLARNMRQNPTPAERKLWYEYLRNVSVRVLRQKPIDRFIVDLLCVCETGDRD